MISSTEGEPKSSDSEVDTDKHEDVDDENSISGASDEDAEEHGNVDDEDFFWMIMYRLSCKDQGDNDDYDVLDTFQI